MKEIRVDVTDSTQTLAKRLSHIIEGDFIVIAKTQYKGYGRYGRKWFSPEGGLWATLTIRNISIERLTMMPMIAGIAAAETLQKYINMHVKLKWPNDLIIGDKKIGGILCEAEIEEEKVKNMFIGIGVNINISERELLKELKDKATSLMIETNKTHNINEILFEIVNKIYSLMNEKSEKIIEKWKAHDYLAGRKVKISLEGQTLIGRTKINSDGSLTIITESGEEYRLYSNRVERVDILNS